MSTGLRPVLLLSTVLPILCLATRTEALPVNLLLRVCRKLWKAHPQCGVVVPQPSPRMEEATPCTGPMQNGHVGEEEKPSDEKSGEAVGLLPGNVVSTLFR